MPGTTQPRGQDILKLARKHLGEKYSLGCTVPKNNASWHGPWDCAEFASWLIYQDATKLYGCNDDEGDPVTEDAYTGFWSKDAETKGRKVSVDEAANTPGAAVLRVPLGKAYGHIVISDGAGGTIEAYSTRMGVITSTLAYRRWDTGVLVPGIQYAQVSSTLHVPPPKGTVYRLTDPRMTGSTVKEIQRALKREGFDPGGIDGEFGPMTEAAVIAFQMAKGLLADGEVGPKTAHALGLELPPAD